MLGLEQCPIGTSAPWENMSCMHTKGRRSRFSRCCVCGQRRQRSLCCLATNNGRNPCPLRLFANRFQISRRHPLCALRNIMQLLQDTLRISVLKRSASKCVRFQQQAGTHLLCKVGCIVLQNFSSACFIWQPKGYNGLATAEKCSVQVL